MKASNILCDASLQPDAGKRRPPDQRTLGSTAIVVGGGATIDAIIGAACVVGPERLNAARVDCGCSVLLGHDYSRAPSAEQSSVAATAI